MRCICQSKMQGVTLAPGDYNYIFGLSANGSGIVFLNDPGNVSDQCRVLFGYGPRKLTPEELMLRRTRLKWERKQRQRAAEKKRKAREAARAAAKKRHDWHPKPYSAWAREMAAAYRDKQGNG